ncbi:cadmium resistance transporter [Aeromicrobium stalagmiti]|uniref:cadmium resistance transporter n=1 Tax=Aeromicrobium stalagmiti TaxID=2738988 RepID=UPI001568D7D7|nr:cadmium resistance transporter [Aeromicrobium stalagmiti]
MITVVNAVGLFVATNLDDIVVLTVLFGASARGGARGWSIVAGQYLGFIVLVILSAVAALGLTIVSDSWVGLLGLVPMAIGVLALVRTIRNTSEGGEDQTVLNAGGILGVAGITFANGGDNIAIYTPVFRTMSMLQATTTIVVFLIMVALWCGISRLVGTRDTVVDGLEKIEGWLVPAVFIGLGLYILISAGTLEHVMG